MTTYLLSAAGVIFLSVIISLIIPEGKLNKTVVFVMRLCCIFVLIQPITGIFKISSGSSLENFYDYEYISKAYSDNQSAQLEKLLEEKFEIETTCTVTVGYSDGNFKVESVEVAVYDDNVKILEDIYAYLDGLGYINITVYAKTA